MATHTGKVVWFNNAKGYGFVSQENGPDIFCHFSSIQADGYRGLKENTLVEYDIETGPAGKLQTANLRALSNSPSESSPTITRPAVAPESHERQSA